MNLIHIKVGLQCPSCNSRVVAEKQHRRHLNGEWNEERQFECGAFYTYSPNLVRTEEVLKCPNSAEMRKRDEERKAFVAKVEKLIAESAVDEDFRNRVLRDLKYAISYS